jgi:HK97 family phage major capsid protein
MKKEFLTLVAFMAVKGITQEAFDGMPAEEQAKVFNDLNENNAQAIKEMKDANVSKEDLQKAIQDLNDARLEQMKTLNKALEEMGLAIKASSEPRKEGQGAHNDLRKALEDNKDKIKLLKSSREGSFSIELKAAGTMLESTNISGGNVPVEQRLAGLNTVASRRVRLMDIMAAGTASSNIISWVYQANKDGAAGGTLEGATKNVIDFDLVVASQAVVKRTAFIKVSTEMLDDIDFIETEIRNELMRELMKDVEGTAYSGNNTAPNLNGVRTTATAFAAGSFAGTVDNANAVDVLVVAMNQIKIAEQGMPNYILMHPTNVTALKLVKVTASDKRYVDRLAIIGGTLSLDGVPIIETTLVTVGEYLVGDFNLSTLYSKGSIRVEMGLDGNDYTKNLRTILAEWRGAVVVKNNDRTAFVKGVFATDAAALETA